MFEVKFWGVRGSVPAPLTPAQVQNKVEESLRWYKDRGTDHPNPPPFHVRSTFGGNTTCVEVNCGPNLFILDMGTGVRELGNAQMADLLKTKRLVGTILQSHVHWDHIQGFPFWKPLYMPRREFSCIFEFFGGKEWDSQIDLVYRGQMNPPMFPVNLAELEQTTMVMNFRTIWDGWEKSFVPPLIYNSGGGRVIRTNGGPDVEPTQVIARKLFHPQETFGYRLTYKPDQEPRSLAFTTDHEPYASGVPKPLLELVDNADVWITDCQYSHDEYAGKVGPQKMGWGHSFPEYIATVAKEAKPKKIVTTHHDPEASDLHIVRLAQQIQELSGIETIPSYEGLCLTL